VIISSISVLATYRGETPPGIEATDFRIVSFAGEPFLFAEVSKKNGERNVLR
jgi:hypothetical protein